MIRALLIIVAVLAVDSPEIQRWRSCQSRPGVQQNNDACRPLDLDHDGDVDQDDFGAWQRRIASVPSVCPPCEPCPCDPSMPHGAQITCQVWRAMPADMQAEWEQWNQEFGARLATRPAH